jgi:hypothetical protein
MGNLKRVNKRSNVLAKNVSALVGNSGNSGIMSNGTMRAFCRSMTMGRKKK